MNVIANMNLVQRNPPFRIFCLWVSIVMIWVRCGVMHGSICTIKKPLIRAFSIASAVLQLDEALMSVLFDRISKGTDVRTSRSLQWAGTPQIGHQVWYVFPDAMLR